MVELLRLTMILTGAEMKMSICTATVRSPRLTGHWEQRRIPQWYPAPPEPGRNEPGSSVLRRGADEGCGTVQLNRVSHRAARSWAWLAPRARYRGKLSHRSSSLIQPGLLSNQTGPALHRCNWHRPQQGIAGLAPISRLVQFRNILLSLHS